MDTPANLNITVLALASLASSATAALTLTPGWQNDPNTTETSYLFTTDNKTAAPESYRNSYGIPALSVNDNPVNSDGWQELGTIDATRTSDSGAWDLGQGDESIPTGFLTIDVPVGTHLGLGSRDLEVFVEFVWYLGPVIEPLVSISGANPLTSAKESEMIVFDGLGFWQRTVWEASFANFTDDTATLVLNAPEGFGSVIEEVNIYTLTATPIPEPSLSLLLLLSFTALFRRRR